MPERTVALARARRRLTTNHRQYTSTTVGRIVVSLGASGIVGLAIVLGTAKALPPPYRFNSSLTSTPRAFASFANIVTDAL